LNRRETTTPMKANERHHLKQNEFATGAAHLVDSLSVNRNRVALILGGTVLAIAIAAGVIFWRSGRANDAGAAFGAAMATAQGAVVPPSTLPGAVQQAGTFPTEQARAEAAIKAFTDVATKYPGTDVGLAAADQAAAEQLALGQAAEAEQAFAAVAAQAGSSLYGAVAKMGQAEAMMAAGKTAEAVALYTTLSADRDGALPVDGVLMELGKASLKAGKSAEAKAAFKRVVDEFPESTFVADARERATNPGTGSRPVAGRSSQSRAPTHRTPAAYAAADCRGRSTRDRSRGAGAPA
jgi:hypothetical protein